MKKKRNLTKRNDIGVSVKIEGAPLEELFKTLVRLCPQCMEIWAFAYRCDPIAGYFMPRPPKEALDSRIAVRRRCYDYFEPELKKGLDGGLFIQMGCNGVELHLGEKDAMDFITCIREWRRDIEEVTRRQLQRNSLDARAH